MLQLSKIIKKRYAVLEINKKKNSFTYLCLWCVFLGSTNALAAIVAGIPDGKGAVDKLGAFTYKIPVKVAPGINNLTPELSLVYSSQSASSGSPLGIGWNVAGLSEIHRCGKTLAQEGVRDGVKFNRQSDRLCRDGTPLINSWGGGRYWNSGSSYHPLNEDWTKIKPQGSCGNGPCSFIAYLKNGRTMEYGEFGQGQSIKVANGSVARWHLRRVVDSNGNEINYSYTSAGVASLVVSRIDYKLSHNVSGSIRFHYSTKDEASSANGYYSDGDSYGKYSYNQRLNRIEVFADNTVFKTYHLNFNASLTNESPLLGSVQECDGHGACYEPIEFEWNNPSSQNGFFHQTIPSLAEIGVFKTNRDTPITHGDDGVFNERLIMGAHQGYGAKLDYGVQLIPGDWNSDGKMDFIRQEYCANPNGFAFEANEFDADSYCYGGGHVTQDANTFGFHLSNGDGTFSSHYPTDHGQQADHVSFMEQHDFGEKYSGANIIPGDFNGDGHLDYIRQEYGEWARQDNHNTAQLFLNKGYNNNGFPLFNKIQLNQGQDEINLKGAHAIGNDIAGVRIIPGDFNGDMITDFIRLAEGRWADELDFATYLSKGDGTFTVVLADEQTENLRGYNKGSGVNLITGDFNGDGRTDFIRQEFGDAPNNPSNPFGIYFSNGDGSFSETISNVNTLSLMGSHTERSQSQGAAIVTGDYNGDGLTDFIRQEHGAWALDSVDNFQVYFSRGNGDFDIVTPSGINYQVNLKAEDDYEEPLVATRSDGWRNQPDFYGANLITGDFNGDRKTDFIRQETRQWAQSDNSKSFQVYLSKGDGYFDILTPPANTEPQKQLKGLHWYKLRNHETALWYRTGVTILPGDYDGDGRSDFIAQRWDAGTEYDGLVGSQINPHIPAFSVWFNPNSDKTAQNTIKLVRKGRLEQHVSYENLSNHDVILDAIPSGFEEIQFPLWVVTELEVTPENPASDVADELISYRYGRLLNGYFNPLLGFTSIVEHHQERGVTKTTKFKFLAKNGVAVSQPQSVTIKAGNNLVSKKLFDWQQRLTDVGTVSLELKNETTEKYFNNDNPLVETVAYRYDEYSNVIKETTTAGSETKSKVTRYHYDQANWNVAQIDSVVIASGQCSVAGNNASCNNNRKVQETRFSYYNNTRNLKKKMDVVSWQPFLAETSEYEYDSYGRVSSITNPNDVKYQISYESSRFSETVVSRVNSDWIEKNTRDLRWGSDTESVDLNKQIVKRSYDSFGRLKSVHQPNETGRKTEFQKVTYNWVAGNNGDLLKESTWIRSGWNNGFTKHVFSDVLGRKVKESKSSGFNTFSEKTWLYNAKGQLEKESLTGGSGAKEYKTFIYNGFERVKTIRPASGHLVNIDYKTDDAFCDSNQVMVEKRIGNRVNAQCHRFDDKISKVIHESNANPFVQTTHYDVLGNVTEVIDSSGFKTTTHYDGLSRKTLINSTERGKEKFVYNDAGQLTRWEHYGSNNALLGSINYSYADFMGRVTKEAHSDQRVVGYTYDNKSFSHAMGRLSGVVIKQNNATVWQREFSYHPTSQVKSINTTLGGDTYGLSFKYTPQGKRQKVFYPNARTASYEYDVYGHLKKVLSNGKLVASYGDFTPVGHYREVSYGNGIDEVRSFDSLHRLSDLTVRGNELIHIDQKTVYNDYGEVEEITNYLDSDYSQRYGYNALGYLDWATGPWPNRLVYDYDSNGNLKKKDGKSYQYLNNRLLSKGQSDLFTYNEAGSLKTRKQGSGNQQVTSTYHYTSQQKLSSIVRGGQQTKFDYDHTGSRFVKENANGNRVYYVAPEFEVFVDGGKQQQTAYVLDNNGSRVASFTPKATNNGMLAGFAKHQQFTHLYGDDSFSGLANKAYHTVAMMMHHPATITALAMVPGVIISLTLGAFLMVWLRAAPANSLLARLRLWMSRLLLQMRLIDKARFNHWHQQYTTEFIRDHRFLAKGVPMVVLSMVLSMTLPGTVSTAEAAQGDPAGTQYYHYNQVGSTVLVTNCNGDVMAKPVYKPFGEVYNGKGNKPYRYGFGSKEVDNGLHYFESRYYDAGIGRFLQADIRSLGTNMPNAAQLNRYAYSLNNPINYADPTGEAVSGVVIAIAIHTMIILFSELWVSQINNREYNWTGVATQIAITIALTPLQAGFGGAWRQLTTGSKVAMAKTASEITSARLVTLGMGALGGAGYSALNQLNPFKEKDPNEPAWDWGELFMDVAVGAFAGGVSVTKGKINGVLAEDLWRLNNYRIIDGLIYRNALAVSQPLAPEENALPILTAQVHLKSSQGEICGQSASVCGAVYSGLFVEPPNGRPLFSEYSGNEGVN